MALAKNAQADAVLRESKHLTAMKESLEAAYQQLEEVEEERNTYMTRCQLLDKQLLGERAFIALLPMCWPRLRWGCVVASTEYKSAFAERVGALQNVADQRCVWGFFWLARGRVRHTAVVGFRRSARVIEGLQQDLVAFTASAAPAGPTSLSSTGTSSSPQGKDVARLQRDLEAMARKLSARDAEIVELQDKITEQGKMVVRLSLLLEESEAGLLFGVRDGHDGGAADDDGGGDDDGSPGRNQQLAPMLSWDDPSRQRDAVLGQLSFLLFRDSEAESVLGCVCALLAEVQQLCAVLQLRLNADKDAFALAEVVSYTSKKGVPPPPVHTNPRRVADELSRFLRSRAAVDDAPNLASSDELVMDRHAVVNAITSISQSVSSTRICVAERLSEQVGTECAMQ